MCVKGHPSPNTPGIIFVFRYPDAISANPSRRKVTHIYLNVQTGGHFQPLSTKLQGIVLGNHYWMKEDQQKIMGFELHRL